MAMDLGFMGDKAVYTVFRVISTFPTKLEIVWAGEKIMGNLLDKMAYRQQLRELALLYNAEIKDYTV